LFALGVLVALELATRIDQRIEYGAPLLGAYSWDASLLTRDAFGTTGRPGGVYEKWALNDLGLRGPGISKERPPDTRRIVTVGTSETFGLYESPGHEWPRELERLLAEDGEEAEVVNGAFPGLGPASLLVHVRHRLVPLEPTEIVWVVHAALFAGTTPDQLRWLVAHPGGNAPERPGPLAAAVTPRLLRHVQEAVLPRAPEVVRRTIERVELAWKSWRTRRALGADYRRLRSVTEEEVAAFVFVLDALRDSARDAGATLDVVFPPHRIDDRSLDLHYVNLPRVDEAWLRSSATRLVAAAEREAERDPRIRVVDLRALFAGHEASLMADMVHFNDAGAARFAGGVAVALSDDAIRGPATRSPSTGPGHARRDAGSE
jgi:hypothetical protein